MKPVTQPTCPDGHDDVPRQVDESVDGHTRWFECPHCGRRWSQHVTEAA